MEVVGPGPGNDILMFCVPRAVLSLSLGVLVRGHFSFWMITQPAIYQI